MSSVSALGEIICGTMLDGSSLSIGDNIDFVRRGRSLLPANMQIEACLGEDAIPTDAEIRYFIEELQPNAVSIYCGNSHSGSRPNNLSIAPLRAARAAGGCEIVLHAADHLDVGEIRTAVSEGLVDQINIGPAFRAWHLRALRAAVRESDDLRQILRRVEAETAREVDNFCRSIQTDHDSQRSHGRTLP